MENIYNPFGVNFPLLFVFYLDIQNSSASHQADSKTIDEQIMENKTTE
jgi:hypothetical protein